MYNFTTGPIKINEKLIINEQPIPHRSNIFKELYKNISIKNLDYLNCNNNYSSILLTGSGTLSVEILISNYTVNKNCLYISNGYFGDKWIDIANIYKDNIIYYVKKITENLDCNIGDISIDDIDYMIFHINNYFININNLIDT